MAIYSLDEVPERVQELIARARGGQLSPSEFYQELGQLGVTGPVKMFYVRDAFDLSLQEAKKVFLQMEYGSVDAWADEMGRAIDEAASDLESAAKPKS